MTFLDEGSRISGMMVKGSCRERAIWLQRMPLKGWRAA